MKKQLFPLFYLLCLFSCKEEELSNVEKSKIYCRENMVFECTNATDLTRYTSWFKGNLNGDDFCVIDSSNRYKVYYGIGTETITPAESPVYTPGLTPSASFFGIYFSPPIKNNFAGILEEFKAFVILSTPRLKDTVLEKRSMYIERFLKKGNLNLLTPDTDKYSAFDFDISWGCALLPGYDYYYNKNEYRIPTVAQHLSPKYGKQKNVVFRISELHKEVFDFHTTYDITFDISCSLYYEDGDYFGELKNGVFKIKMDIPVND